MWVVDFDIIIYKVIIQGFPKKTPGSQKIKIFLINSVMMRKVE